MSDNFIDLQSDTQTRPTPGMREAIANAEVGDEQRGEDPSVNKLVDRVAELLGKEAAVFLPSGCMCNNIAILVHCRPGDAIISDQSAHIVTTEGGAMAALAGVMPELIAGERGVFGPEQVLAAIRPKKRNLPRSRMVAIEQTANLAGGTVWPLATLEAVSEAAHEKGLVVHMDGARLLNAVAASGDSAKAYSAPCDTVWIDLSKGLGCPVGGVLAGTAEFIEEAWLWKHRLGGAMRQAGVLAAAGLYALDHHVERLAQDNKNIRLFAEKLVGAPGIAIDLDRVESNIAFFDVSATG
ncbi:MAG: threonine aldolase family protein, partial [Alphaproteobacteria bacterium]